MKTLKRLKSLYYPYLIYSLYSQIYFIASKDMKQES